MNVAINVLWIVNIISFLGVAVSLLMGSEKIWRNSWIAVFVIDIGLLAYFNNYFDNLMNAIIGAGAVGLAGLWAIWILSSFNKK